MTLSKDVIAGSNYDNKISRNPGHYPSWLHPIFHAYQSHSALAWSAQQEVGSVGTKFGAVDRGYEAQIQAAFYPFVTQHAQSLPKAILLFQTRFYEKVGGKTQEFDTTTSAPPGVDREMLLRLDLWESPHRPWSKWYLPGKGQIYTYKPYSPNSPREIDIVGEYNPTSPNFIGVDNLKGTRFGSVYDIASPGHSLGVRPQIMAEVQDQFTTAQINTLLVTMATLGTLNEAQQVSLDETREGIFKIQSAWEEGKEQALRRHGELLIESALKFLAAIKQYAPPSALHRLDNTIDLTGRRHRDVADPHILLDTKNGALLTASPHKGWRRILGRMDISRPQPFPLDGWDNMFIPNAVIDQTMGIFPKATQQVIRYGYVDSKDR